MCQDLQCLLGPRRRWLQELGILVQHQNPHRLYFGVAARLLAAVLVEMAEVATNSARKAAHPPAMRTYLNQVTGTEAHPWMTGISLHWTTMIVVLP